jgi:hypothetical protein
MGAPDAYRAPPPATKIFSTNLRVLPCRGCGKPLQVGLSADCAPCPGCGAELAYGDAPDTHVPHSPAMPESERLRRLAEQRGEPWVTRPETLRWQDLMAKDLPEAWQAWAELARSVEADPRDADAADVLFNVSINIGNALASDPERDLEKRGLFEGALETLRTPHMRQFFAANLATGASRAGDLASARQWLARMDPQSTSLLGDSQYRSAAAFIATAEQRYDAVLAALHRRQADLPCHYVSSAQVTLLRANALEKTGDLSGAVHELLLDARQDRSALTSMHKIASRTPAWALCAASLPIVTERELSRRCAQAFGGLPPGLAFALLALALFGVVAFGLADGRMGWSALAVAALGCACVVLWRRAARRPHPMASGCVAVKGRILGARATSGGFALDVALEPLGGSSTETTTVLPAIPSPLSVNTIVGRTFSGFWSPERPDKFVEMIFNVTPQEQAAPR